MSSSVYEHWQHSPQSLYRSLSILLYCSQLVTTTKNSRIAALCLKVEPFFIQWLFLSFKKYKQGCMLLTILLLFQKLGAIFQFHYALLQFQMQRQFCIFMLISLSFSTLCQRPWRLTQIEQHKFFLFLVFIHELPCKPKPWYRRSSSKWLTPNRLCTAQCTVQ